MAGITSSAMRVLTRFELDRDDFERRHAEVDAAWERDEIGVTNICATPSSIEPRSFHPG